jgi:hypothetical protein
VSLFTRNKYLFSLDSQNPALQNHINSAGTIITLEKNKNKEEIIIKNEIKILLRKNIFRYII